MKRKKAGIVGRWLLVLAPSVALGAAVGTRAGPLAAALAGWLACTLLVLAAPNPHAAEGDADGPRP